MIRILLVDDEIFTREGIITEIPWNEMGSIEIKQAYDGIDALEIAEEFIPDILLTDVRMPRMNGIELSFKIRELYPSCEIIFLSGYSDKEYLKSAIKLKAISYVEKPIDIEELKTAIESAIAVKLKEMKNIKSTIALNIIKQNADITNLNNYFHIDYFNELHETNFITVLIKVLNNNNLLKETILLELEKIVTEAGFNCISAYKEDSLILMHLYWNKSLCLLSKNIVLEDLYFLLCQYLKPITNFYICEGKRVLGTTQIHISYKTALDALNKTFFYDYNSIIYYDKINTLVYKLNEDTIKTFSKHLSSEDKQNSVLLINRLTYEIKGKEGTPINYIKDIYYKLLLQLLQFASDRKLTIPQVELSNKCPFEYLSNLCTLMEIKSYVLYQLEIIFKTIEEKNLNTNHISSIIKYIHLNYSDVNLSLQDISNKTYLTTAYMCAIFKEETGSTINAYITKYRIEKAKILLKDQNMKITDISAKVGFSDGNYFSKTFKKETSFNPSEYRRKFFS